MSAPASGEGRVKREEGRRKARGQAGMADVRPNPKPSDGRIDVVRPQWALALRQSLFLLLVATAVGLSVNALRPDRLPLVADWSLTAQLSSVPGGEPLVITLEEVQMLYFGQQAVFLDARSAEAFQAGHIEGARNLPWDAFEELYPEVMANISTDTVIITYCDGEACSLSKDLALALIAKGFPQARVLPDGWRQWQEASLPTGP